MNPYIAKALAHWKTTPWSAATMEAAFRAPGNETIHKLSLNGGHAMLETSAQPERTAPIGNYFREIAAKQPDLRLTIYLCTADHPELIISDEAPFFTLAKTIASRFIVIPDQFFTRDFSRYHRSSPQDTLDADVDRNSLANPWPEKQAQAVFRSNDFKYAEICKAALAMPDLVDAKIGGQPANCGPELRALGWKELATDYPTGQICGERIDISGQLKYKYLLNTPACWDSTYWKLRSNSLLFNIDMVYNHSSVADHLSTHQWYSYFMEPFKHYIPCTMDDLPEMITWARAHDDEALQIADEGTRLVKEQLTYAKSQDYVSQLLKEFSLIR